jgi:fused signal recognition particle receptor
MSFFDKLKKTVNSAVESTKEAITGAGDALGFARLKDGLTRTRETLVNRLATALLPGRKIDEALMSEIEDILLTADIGVKTTTTILTNVRTLVRKQGLESADGLYDLIKQEILRILRAGEQSTEATSSAASRMNNDTPPYVMMVVGVNGVGKTTSIGKLAHNFKNAGQTVLIGAADTFRAAANEQLEIWAERAGVEIVKQGQGADPAAVAFDTLQAAIARKADVVIIDTAGRLHNKTGLMAELEKMSRVMRKLKPTAPDEVFLVLDATTGQNALQQAKEFTKVAPVTGLILTKLDGTAKGGVVIAVANEFKIPVRYIGVGEQIGDLQLFDPTAFAEALFAKQETTEAV